MMRLFIAALLMTLGTQAWAECGNLCNDEWWKTATTADLKAELDAGADVMARSKAGGTPLHSAAFFGTPESIQALLKSGADVMARSKAGVTPLYSAAVSRTPENIQVLLKAGADVMARNEDGWTPLHLAAGYGEKAGVIEALLEAGADPKRNNQNGKTPWDLAQDNDKLKDTKSYWALNDARYN
jgi:ankyrin repeat protein